MKVAVVTPYYRESAQTLRRCHQSVISQTAPCRHILVADGHASSEVAAFDADHMVLPVSHGDNGNTPRGLGGLSALNSGFDGVFFLDADNWYAPDHVEATIAAAKLHDADVVFSDRQVVLSTGELCAYDDVDILSRRFVDTSSIFIRSTAPRLILAWVLMDQSLSPICDRVMCAAVQSTGAKVAWTDARTVFYESRWRSHFLAMGKAPPVDEHHTDWAAMRQSYSADANINRLGFDPFAGRSPFDNLRFELASVVEG